jgi:hypothetical protein
MFIIILLETNLYMSISLAYSFSRFCLINLYFNFRRIPKCLDTLKIIFSMWLFHLASLDKVTPKRLWLVVIGILFPLNVKLKLYLTSVIQLYTQFTRRKKI